MAQIQRQKIRKWDQNIFEDHFNDSERDLEKLIKIALIKYFVYQSNNFSKTQNAEELKKVTVFVQKVLCHVHQENNPQLLQNQDNRDIIQALLESLLAWTEEGAETSSMFTYFMGKHKILPCSIYSVLRSFNFLFQFNDRESYINILNQYQDIFKDNKCILSRLIAVRTNHTAYEPNFLGQNSPFSQEEKNFLNLVLKEQKLLGETAGIEIKNTLLETIQFSDTTSQFLYLNNKTIQKNNQNKSEYQKNILKQIEWAKNHFNESNKSYFSDLITFLIERAIDQPEISFDPNIINSIILKIDQFDLKKYLNPLQLELNGRIQQWNADKFAEQTMLASMKDETQKNQFLAEIQTVLDQGINTQNLDEINRMIKKIGIIQKNNSKNNQEFKGYLTELTSLKLTIEGIRAAEEAPKKLIDLKMIEQRMDRQIQYQKTLGDNLSNFLNDMKEIHSFDQEKLDSCYRHYSIEEANLSVLELNMSTDQIQTEIDQLDAQLSKRNENWIGYNTKIQETLTQIDSLKTQFALARKQQNRNFNNQGEERKNQLEEDDQNQNQSQIPTQIQFDMSTLLQNRHYTKYIQNTNLEQECNDIIVLLNKNGQRLNGNPNLGEFKIEFFKGLICVSSKKSHPQNYYFRFNKTNQSIQFLGWGHEDNGVIIPDSNRKR